MIVNLAQLAFFKNQINESSISNEFSKNLIVNHFWLVCTIYILETFDFVFTSMYFYDWKIKIKYKRYHSGVDSGGAGGARAPPEFGGSEQNRGEAWFLLIGV